MWKRAPSQDDAFGDGLVVIGDYARIAFGDVDEDGQEEVFALCTGDWMLERQQRRYDLCAFDGASQIALYRRGPLALGDDGLNQLRFVERIGDQLAVVGPGTLMRVFALANGQLAFERTLPQRPGRVCALDAETLLLEPEALDPAGAKVMRLTGEPHDLLQGPGCVGPDPSLGYLAWPSALGSKFANESPDPRVGVQALGPMADELYAMDFDGKRIRWKQRVPNVGSMRASATRIYLSPMWLTGSYTLEVRSIDSGELIGTIGKHGRSVPVEPLER